MMRIPNNTIRISIITAIVCALAVLMNVQAAKADVDQIREDVEKLASDEMAGRRPGTGGIELAAKLIEERFADLGLEKPGGDYRQTFEVIENLEIGTDNSLSLSMIVPKRGIPKERLKPVSRKLKLGQDFTPINYSGNGSAEGELVFAGFGISNPNKGYDDYEGVDMDGKIAIVLTGSPDNRVFRGYGSNNYKIENAQNKGAAGVILLGMKGDSANVLPKMAYMEVMGKATIPVVYAQRKKVEKFFPRKLSLITLEEKIVSTQEPASEVLKDRTAKITVELKNKVVETANVTGIVRGTDEPEEYIVIGGHYDHLGTNALNSMKPSAKGEIHNGADDNASGTALMLDLAERISKNPLKKSVLFIAFTSEEMGLLGSGYFVKDPIVELGSIKAMINLDMVGMLKDSLTIYGTGSAAGLEELVNQAAELSDIKTRNVNLPHGPSDHIHFYRNNIPAMHLFTGLHPHFHSPSDDVENLNYDGINKIGDFVYELANSITKAELEYMIASTESEDNYLFGEMNMNRKATGIYHSFEYNEAGLELLEVVRGSRAWSAGLRPGDMITKMNGKNVNSTTAIGYNIADIVSRLSAEELRAGVPINFTVMRDGREMKIQVEL